MSERVRNQIIEVLEGLAFQEFMGLYIRPDHGWIVEVKEYVPGRWSYVPVTACKYFEQSDKEDGYEILFSDRCEAAYDEHMNGFPKNTFLQKLQDKEVQHIRDFAVISETIDATGVKTLSNNVTFRVRGLVRAYPEQLIKELGIVLEERRLVNESLDEKEASLRSIIKQHNLL